MKKQRILKNTCALALAVLLLVPFLTIPASADGLGLNTDTKPASQSSAKSGWKSTRRSAFQNTRAWH